MTNLSIYCEDQEVPVKGKQLLCVGVLYHLRRKQGQKLKTEGARKKET